MIPGEPPESQNVWARCFTTPACGAGLQAVRPSGSQDSHTPQLEEGPQPLSRPPPADMPPVNSEAFTKELPQPQQDDAASPANVRHTVYEKQVKDAAECMHKFREMIHTLEGILDAPQPATQDSGIEKLDYAREALVELTTNIKSCAWIQNIAECRLEVAAPLYLVFEMIIQVM